MRTPKLVEAISSKLMPWVYLLYLLVFKKKKLFHDHSLSGKTNTSGIGQGLHETRI